MFAHRRTRGSRLVLLLVVVVASLHATAAVRAQPSEAAEAHAATPTAEERERARAAFVAGATAIEEGRWADAVDLFRTAFDLTGSPVALFNLGYAYRALGRSREARDAFDRVLTGELDADSRTETEALRDEVAARVATLELEGLDYPAASVRIDAHSVDAEGPFELDPGAHTASVHVPGHETWEWSGDLAAGAHTRVAVELVALPAASSGGNIAEEPWLWIILGVVVLAGAGVAIWAVDDSQQLRPEGPVLRL